MRKRRNAILVLLLALPLSGWYAEDYFTTAGYAPSILPEYSPPTDRETRLLIKDVKATGEALLLKASNREDVFLYNPSAKTIERVKSQEWEKSNEKEIDCSQQQPGDDYSGSSNGYYILNAKKSQDNTKLAVVSAYGPKTPGFAVLPNLGGTGRIWGTRYLEIKRIPGYEAVGRPFRLKLLDLIHDPDLCWSDRSQYIVVHHQASNISVVNIQEN